MSIRKTFVIVSVSSRVNELNRLLHTIKAYVEDFDSWDVCVLFQDNQGNASLIENFAEWRRCK